MKQKKRILLSWESINRDYILNKNGKPVEVDLQGLHSSIYKNEMNYDIHYLLSSERSIEERPYFKVLVKHLKKFSKTELIPLHIGINDVISITEIFTKIKTLVLKLQIEHEQPSFDFFITPGTPSMQTAWYLVAASLRETCSIQLFFIRPEQYRKAGFPLKEYEKLEQSSLTTNLILLEEGFNQRNRKTYIQDFHITPTLTPIIDLAEKIAITDVSVMIFGGSGTGKEIIAEYIRTKSTRKDKAFITVNCAGFHNDELLESRLFGYEQGVFTGADKRRDGEFHFANGGTLFLDEIGDMSLSMQQTLLRVLQTKKIRRIGARDEESINVRIIGATHRNLVEMVNEGTFRLDLFYRLCIAEIYLPSIAMHTEKEKEGILNYFIYKLAKEFNKETLKFSRKAQSQLLGYHFPGNFREFENIIKRLYVLYTGTIEEHQLPQFVKLKSIKTNSLLLEDIEESHIKEVIKMFPNNKQQVCRALGITINTLESKLKKMEK